MSVTLDTKTISTDAFAGLSNSSVTYTTATFSWVNVSASAATFRLVLPDTGFESEEIIVGGGATGTYTLSGLQAGSEGVLFLERFEVDTWIRQTSSTSGIDYVQTTTLDTSVSVSVGSASASVSWNNPGVTGDYVYSLEIVNQNGVEFSSVITDHSAIVPDLVQGDTYSMRLYVTEGSGVATEIGKSSGVNGLIEFSPALSAQIEITDGPFASYVSLDWSASVTDASSEYRVVSRDATSGNDDVLVEKSNVRTAIVADLIPGTSYIFVLQRLELDGTWEDQSQTVISTPTTSISIGSIASQTIEVTWGSLYENANYELLFNGTSSGVTTDTSVILRDLESDTSYTLELVVRELNETVGISKLGVTTNQSLVQSLKLPITLPVAAVILIVIFMIMKK